MNNKIIVWTKPLCVQCNAVKKRLVQRITGESGLPRPEVDAHFETLVQQGKIEEYDLSDPRFSEDLEYFKSHGLTSAPITEYKGHIVSGYNTEMLDNLLRSWESDAGQEGRA